MKGKIEYLTTQDATDFLLPKHYSGRKPQITKAFGWKIDGQLVAVCTFGKPASPTLCDGICGKENSSHVYELNRLCRIDGLDEPLSAFVSACLRRLRSEDWIIVSYADTGMSHHGYIYQACNFIYTGVTKSRTDKYTGAKHSRHYDKESPQVFRQIRTAKHRYVYFATFDRRLKRQWGESLRYPQQPYPKGDNQNYILGEFFTPQLIKVGDQHERK